jgi:glycosyltransferase involved in cell wall biosynthesis
VIESLLEKINTKKKDKYNILTFSTHEGYQTLLDKTGHNFLLFEENGLKEWNTEFRPVPKNHTIAKDVKYYDMEDIDFILSQERFGQLQKSINISTQYRIPIVHLEHIEPQDRWPEEQFEQMKKLKPDFNIFITEHNAKSWGCENAKVIPHGIDTETFKGWEPSESLDVVYIVNRLKERDYFCGYEFWLEVKKKCEEIIPNINFKLIGDNPGMSSPISNTEELVKELRSCCCYVNTSQLSPIPMSLLEAMSCGCPVVSTAKQEIPKVINNKNGYITNDTTEFAEKVCEIVKDKQIAKDYGKNARETIIEKMSVEKFCDEWNSIFDEAYKMRIGRSGYE